MAVDLGDLIDTLKRELSPPGTDLYPNAQDDEWAGQLSDAFWDARLDGMLADWTADEDGLVTPVAEGGDDISRDLQQLVVLYASFRVLRSTLRNMRTQFKAQAGNVSFEYQQSANLLNELMKDIITRRDIILTRLSDVGSVPTYIIDGVIARDANIRYGNQWWVD